MTDAPHSDDASAGDDSDEVPADGSRIDEFLERFEAEPKSTTPSPTDDDTTASLVDEFTRSTPSAADEPPTGGNEAGTGTDHPTGGNEAGTGDEPPTEDDDSITGDDQPTESGRLWDSFGGGDDEPRDQPRDPADGTPETGGQGGGDREVDPASSRESPDSNEPTTGEQTGAEPAVGAEGKGETGNESTGSGTSFRSILDRISHRIGSVGSGSSDESSGTEASTGTKTSTDEPTTDSRAAGGADTAASTGESAGGTVGPTGAASTGESSQSDPIEEILNNIDLFARATSSSQVLLLSPTVHSITNDMYTRFLLPTDGSGQNVLFVSATQSASDQLAAAREIPNWREGKTAVIEVGQSALKPARPGTEADITTRLDIHKRITNLNHLAKLGINISHIVSQWNADRRPTVVGVHTLSAIQQYVGNETMFQFLFTLKGQLNSMGVMGFYHMDPAVHSENELDTIQSAFDLVIEVGSDGSVDIL